MAAKKKIIGQSKLNPTSKPPGKASLETPSPTPETPNIMKHEVKLKPTSYRLDMEDKQRLRQIIGEVKKQTVRGKVSETQVIRALIYLGSTMPPERILKAIREIM